MLEKDKDAYQSCRRRALICFWSQTTLIHEKVRVHQDDTDRKFQGPELFMKLRTAQYFFRLTAISEEKAGSCRRILMEVIPEAHLASMQLLGARSKDTSRNLQEEMKVNAWHCNNHERLRSSNNPPKIVDLEYSQFPLAIYIVTRPRKCVCQLFALNRNCWNKLRRSIRTVHYRVKSKQDLSTFVVNKIR